MKIKYVALLALVMSTLEASATNYKLYSPSEQGGMVSGDGTWTITDPCAASADSQ
jgi:hypothetical protein